MSLIQPLLHRAAFVCAARAVRIALPRSIGVALGTQLIVVGDGPGRGISGCHEYRAADDSGQSQSCSERFHASPLANMPAIFGHPKSEPKQRAGVSDRGSIPATAPNMRPQPRTCFIVIAVIFLALR